MDTKRLKFGADGLVPVIVQDCRNGRVLMMAWANEEALLKTERTRKTHFWSRSRSKIWNKGEQSGNFQEVKEMIADCDGDCVLMLVEPAGPSCHTGKETCFHNVPDGGPAAAPAFEKGAMATIEKVFQTVRDRKENPKNGSYVSALFAAGLDRIARKITEEAGETVIAAKNLNADELTAEVADLWFHCIILLAELGLSPNDIDRELEKRSGNSGGSREAKKV